MLLAVVFDLATTEDDQLMSNDVLEQGSRGRHWARDPRPVAVLRDAPLPMELRTNAERGCLDAGGQPWLLSTASLQLIVGRSPQAMIMMGLPQISSMCTASSLPSRASCPLAHLGCPLVCGRMFHGCREAIGYSHMLPTSCSAPWWLSSATWA